MDPITQSTEPTAHGRGVWRAVVRRAGGIVGAAAVAVSLGAPVAAHATASPEPSPTPPAACGTLPLTTPCAPVVSNTGGAYTLTLPGVGSLVFTVDPVTNQIVSASVSGVDTAFTASNFTINGDGGKASATFTSVATPTQVYTIVARVEPPTTPGAAPTVTATVKSPEKDEKGETGDKDVEDAKDAKDSNKADEHGPSGDKGDHGDKGEKGEKGD